MTSRRSLITAAALTALAFASVAGAADPLSNWQAGVNYRLLENPQPTTIPAGKVEVAEVFWYGCSHCFALDPLLEDWKSKKPAFIEFVRIPVGWAGPSRQHARLYYTLQALQRLDLHPKVFEAIHTKGAVLTDRDETKARALQMAFVTGFGVTEKQFNDAYDSMTVATRVQRGETYTQDVYVTSVPMLIVNGKYATSVGEAGGEAQLLALLTDLAKSEKR